jgi:phosphoribosylaminoimidazole synthetase
LNYAQSGVNRQAADVLVEKIGVLTQATLNKKVKAAIGGYASLYQLDKKRLIAASTDGVGTKLKLAFQTGIHNTVGIDLVAMSVNDLLCVGADPLFFLDYFATGKLDTQIAESVLKGIVEGCKQAGCALVGGETAEMPDFYKAGEYDLAGFAVGIAESKNVLPQKKIRAGDVLIGLPSSGCHSNGYSLLRKMLDGEAGDRKKALGLQLLQPTKIYARELLPLIRSGLVKGLAHITGSGFLNVPRISEKVSYEVTLPGKKPSIYDWVYERSGLGLSELAQTFNMGVGMVMAVDDRAAKKVLSKIRNAFVLGRVISRKGRSSKVWVRDGAQEVVLEY